MCNVIFQGCMTITQQAFALHNSYLVLICDAKTFVPQKRWRIVLDTGLTSCSDLAFDFVQKVNGCLKADFQRSWFHPWSPKKRINCFGHWTVSMCWSGVWLCTRDGRLKTDPLTRVGVTLYNSSLVLICDAKTWSPKKEEKTVLDPGLSLCADQVFDFVQEMGDLKLTH